jgi:polyprenyl P-hydroxybenzoate/phenylacrylic acid decarboxylase-like protein
MRVIVAITGASGAIYGIKLLQELRQLDVETHLVITDWGIKTIQTETDFDYQQVAALADADYGNSDFFSALASGSVLFDAMAIAPCSMKTVSGVRHGFTDNLVLRAADVSIKERRRLVLLVRETPLSSIHLENMLELSRMGVVIMPPVPAFYHRPNSIDDLVAQTVGRLIEQLGLKYDKLRRWRELKTN